MAANPRKPRTRSNGEGTIYERKDGRWAAALYVGGKRKTVYGATKKEAGNKLKQLQKESDSGVDLGSDKLTLGDWLAQWLKARSATLRPRSVDVYRHAIARATESIGHIQLRKLTTLDLNRWLGEMLAQFSATTAAKYSETVRQAIRIAHAEGLMQRNPGALSDHAKPRRYRATVWTPGETLQFLRAAHGTRLEACWHLAIVLGLRRGELAGLRWSDVDLARGTLEVAQQYSPIGGRCEFSPVKTEWGNRSFVLPMATRRELASHRARQLEESEIMGWDPPPLIFCGPNGGPLNPSTAYRAFRATVTAAGVPLIRPHDMRHGAATLLREMGADMTAIQRYMGHSSVATTSDLYTHSGQDEAEGLANLMDHFLSGAAVNAAVKMESTAPKKRQTATK